MTGTWCKRCRFLQRSNEYKKFNNLTMVLEKYGKKAVFEGGGGGQVFKSLPGWCSTITPNLVQLCGNV
jgi:hypothetical protein